MFKHESLSKHMNSTVLKFNKPIGGLPLHLVVINCNFSYNTVFLSFITIIVLFFAQSLLKFACLFRMKFCIILDSFENLWVFF